MFAWQTSSEDSTQDPHQKEEEKKFEAFTGKKYLLKG